MKLFEQKVTMTWLTLKLNRAIVRRDNLNEMFFESVMLDACRTDGRNIVAVNSSILKMLLRSSSKGTTHKKKAKYGNESFMNQSFERIAFYQFYCLWISNLSRKFTLIIFAVPIWKFLTKNIFSRIGVKNNWGIYKYSIPGHTLYKHS